MFLTTSYSHKSFFRELLDWSERMLVLKNLFAEIDILCSPGYGMVHGALPTPFQGHVVIDICSADNCSAKQIDTIVNIGQTLSLRAFSK